MSVAIGRSPFDILEIYVNGVMGGAHCSTFVSDLLHHTNIIYAADIDKLLFRNTLHRAPPCAFGESFFVAKIQSPENMCPALKLFILDAHQLFMATE